MNFRIPKQYVVLSVMMLNLVVFTGCKDQDGLQQKLIGAIGLNPTKFGNGKELKPSDQDKESLINSIQSCPTESKLSGKAYPRGSQQFCSYKDEKGVEVKHGEYRKWYPNGKLQVKSFYADGELEGLYESYYDSGPINKQCSYVHGQEQGLCTDYSKDGKKLSTTTFKEGFKNGPYVKYDKDGKMIERGVFANDLKNGLWEFYDKNGSIKEKGEFKDDFKHGKFIIYNKDGQPSSQGFYSQNEEIGHWIYFGQNGQRKNEGNYVNGKKHGRWVDYDSSGLEVRNTYYDYGKKLDSVKVNVVKNGDGSTKGFGKGDIFGGEPIKARPNNYVRPKKQDNRPAPLEKEGWAPL